MILESYVQLYKDFKMALKINEIFYSIQGESSRLGCPTVFIRLTGCNLRCSFCDTKYAYEDGEEMEIDKIFKEIKKFDCRLVEVTGGEPLFQDETPVLISKLLDDGYTVMLETNGSLDVGEIDGRCIKIIDVKCPSSGEHEKNLSENFKKMNKNDELKFVIETREDYNYAKTQLLEDDIITLPGNIHFSPVFEKLSPQTLSAWILEDNLNVRMTPQLHKFIWPDEDRGV
jgi:7-carboxy-7-deazaguanine synthase